MTLIAIAFFVVVLIIWLKEWNDRENSKAFDMRRRWRQIRTAMAQQQVRYILGEPKSISVEGPSALWKYDNDSHVEFLGNKIVAWSEPK